VIWAYASELKNELQTERSWIMESLMIVLFVLLVDLNNFGLTELV